MSDQQQTVTTKSFNTKQMLFVRYFTAILTDLTVLNLFAEYWDLVIIDSFIISLLAAIMLQVLLKVTLKIEHHVGTYFKTKVLRLISAWVILFASKFIILGAINFVFGDNVLFLGPLHGVVSFIIVLVVMLLAELVIIKIYSLLGNLTQG